MSSQGFQVNRYAERVAIVSEIYRTEDHRFVEIYGVWADDRSAFKNQFVPYEMQLTRGDPVFVIEQIAGLGNQRDAWVAFTSLSAPRNYPMPNLPAKETLRIRDKLAAVPNLALELAAIAAMALLGWQYSWWAAAITGSATATRAGYGRIERYRAGRRVDLARADEQKLFKEASARLAGMEQAWRSANDRSASKEEPRQSQRETPKDEPKSDEESWRTKLKLPADCTLADADLAYRKALKQCHPDLHMNNAPLVQELVEKETRALNRAIEEARAYFA